MSEGIIQSLFDSQSSFVISPCQSRAGGNPLHIQLAGSFGKLSANFPKRQVRMDSRSSRE